MLRVAPRLSTFAALVLLGAQLPALAAAQGRLVMVIDQATEQPMAEIREGRVVGGMNHDLGALLARRMGLDIEYRALPRKRVVDALAGGEGHLVCTYLPDWLPGPLRWSRPFFRQAEVVASRLDAPRPRGLEDLRGQRVGTVLGFVYLELDRALGAGFVREDAPNAQANLRKLAAGRLPHAVVEGRLLAYRLRLGEPPLALHPPLEVSVLHTHCALGPQAPVGPAALNRAIEAIERDGSLAALYRRYD